MVRRGLLLILCAAALSACSPPMSSVMGVTADADGNPVGVVAVCGGYTNEADLQVSGSPGGARQSPDPYADPLSGWGEWVTAEPVTELGTWSLASGDPWTIERPIDLVDGYTYSLRGRGTDDKGFNDSLSIGVEFTLADVAALKPGQVRYAARGDVAATETTYAVVPLEDFRAAACR